MIHQLSTDAFKCTVTERKMTVDMHNTWQSITTPVVVYLSDPRLDRNGFQYYQVAGNMCFRDYIMDSGIALVFSVQLSVKLETAHKEYNETITICQFTYLPKRTVQNALVPEDIKGEFMH